MAKIKLKYGQYFFAGSITLMGTGSEIEIDEDSIDPVLRKSLDVAKMSGVIDHDMQEVKTEVKEEPFVFHDESALEKKAEEQPSEVKSGRKIKRG